MIEIAEGMPWQCHAVLMMHLRPPWRCNALGGSTEGSPAVKACRALSRSSTPTVHSRSFERCLPIAVVIVAVVAVARVEVALAVVVVFVVVLVYARGRLLLLLLLLLACAGYARGVGDGDRIDSYTCASSEGMPTIRTHGADKI